MPKKRWIVCVDWIDGTVEDTCEIVVFADSAASAKATARRRWDSTNRSFATAARVQRVFVLTKKLTERLCY